MASKSVQTLNFNEMSVEQLQDLQKKINNQLNEVENAVKLKEESRIKEGMARVADIQSELNKLISEAESIIDNLPGYSGITLYLGEGSEYTKNGGWVNSNY